MSKEQEKETILVTGFGPFNTHAVNASWVAVGELVKLWEGQSSEGTNGVESRRPHHRLETREIPVAYSVVTETLPQIYSECCPVLCVHVGVSPYKTVVLERCGKNVGYFGGDIFNRRPPLGKCVEDGPEVIETQFDLHKVCESLSTLNKEIDFRVSDDAGRYLCDFIYYRSLHLSACPVLFVHVPPLDTPYSAAQLGRALRDIVEVLLAEVKSTTATVS